jgi:hypothetical protein
MKIKKNQFKGYVKHIVREAIEEAGEQIPKGKLAQLNPNFATGGKDKKLSAPTGKLPSPIRKTNEAGLTSENGEEHGYDEKEEVLLIKVMKLIADKLDAMHQEHELTPVQGMDEPIGGEPVGEPEEPSEEPSPFGSDDREVPIEPENPEGGEEEPSENPFGKSEDEPETDEPKDDDDVPDVNENHKVQARSYMTSDDTSNDPKNVRDPEVPMAEAKKTKGKEGKFKSFPVCNHSKYTLRDDGGYKCSNCGKKRM